MFFYWFFFLIVATSSYAPTQHLPDRKCIVSEWSEWAKCSRECSGGTQHRWRNVVSGPNSQNCPKLDDQRICNLQPCNNDIPRPTDVPSTKGLPVEQHLSTVSSSSSGGRQSPIDLPNLKNSDSDSFDMSLRQEPLTFVYDSKDIRILQNVGTTFRMGTVKHATSWFNAGHLPKSTYRLWEMHGHWGRNHTDGSEHTIDGQGYAAELHFVHWNTRYETVAKAKEHPDGLAVVGVFLEERPVGEKSLDSLASLLKFISNKGDQITLQDGYDLTPLIPKSQDFWTYNGSLTVPPYNECVIWTLLKTPLAISPEQLNALRGLSAIPAFEMEEHRKQNIAKNARPTQAKAGRVVKTSFGLKGN